MKKTVYGFITVLAAFVLGAALYTCDTSSLSGIVNGPPPNSQGETVTVTFSLDDATSTKSVAKGTVINDSYIGTNKSTLGIPLKFAVDGLSLNLAGQAVTVTADTNIVLVWKYNSTTVETWHTVTFTVNGETYPVLVPAGASLAAGKQAELEAFLEVPAGSLAKVTWNDLSNITEDKTPSEITVTTYTVTFDLDYDTENKTSAQSVVSGESVATLPVPSERAEYSFGGWWTQKDGAGTEFTTATTVSATITV
jgi:hypothetical protein